MTSFVSKKNILLILIEPPSCLRSIILQILKFKHDEVTIWVFLKPKFVDAEWKMENTCSTECQEIIHLPYEEQKELRKGKHASNKIFKKGRSEKLKF